MTVNAIDKAKIRALLEKGEDLSNANLSNTNLSQINFSGSHLFGVTFEGSDLVGTNFSGCELASCSFKNADLTKANMANCRLWNSDLTGANLTECDLSGADLWNAKLLNVKMWHTVLANAKSIRQQSFAGDKTFLHEGRINETGLLSAEESYRGLKNYFLSKGMYNDASWASFREKTMERFILRKNRDPHYLPSLVINILCGYGEKVYRIVLSALGTILLFAGIFATAKGVEAVGNPDYILRWADYIYYSAITFTTVGYGDFIPKPYTVFRLMAATEAFLGVFLTGLFIFTLARKYSAR